MIGTFANFGDALLAAAKLNRGLEKPLYIAHLDGRVTEI